MTVSTTIIN